MQGDTAQFLVRIGANQWDYGTAIAYCSALIRPPPLAILLIQGWVPERKRHGVDQEHYVVRHPHALLTGASFRLRCSLAESK